MSIRVTINPSISLAEAKRIGTALEKKLMKYPEVTYAVSQIGRPELGGDPEPISNNELLVVLKDQKEWTTALTRAGLVPVFARDLGAYPCVTMNFGQPIASDRQSTRLNSNNQCENRSPSSACNKKHNRN